MRSQLPNYSPLSVGSIVRAGARAITDPTGAREELERMLGDRFGADEVIVLGSGTQALQVALELVSDSRDQPVALPAYSCYDIVSAAVGTDTGIVFYDIDPVSLAPRSPSLAEALKQPVSAVVAGYLFGYPLDWDELRTRTSEVDVFLIEDAAQGIGAAWNGTDFGHHGYLTILSFGRGKGWTGGAGGALLAREARLADRLRALKPSIAEGGHQVGIKPATMSFVQWALGRPQLYGIPKAVPGVTLGETVYKEPSPPRPAPHFACAAVLNHTDVSFAEARSRRSGGARWAETLPADDSDGFAHCQPIVTASCGYLRYPLVAPDQRTADGLAARLEAHGVTRGYPVALPDLEQAQPLLQRAGEFPGAKELASRLLTLPTHSLVTDRDYAKVARALEIAP